jgi:hypothetical protein
MQQRRGQHQKLGDFGGAVIKDSNFHDFLLRIHGKSHVDLHIAPILTIAATAPLPVRAGIVPLED